MYHCLCVRVHACARVPDSACAIACVSASERVCVRARLRARTPPSVCVCVGVCARERVRESDRDRQRETERERVRERERAGLFLFLLFIPFHFVLHACGAASSLSDFAAQEWRGLFFVY